VKFILLIIGSLLAFSSHAELISSSHDGRGTATDTANGLIWLKLNYTRGYSVNRFEAEYAGSNWRLATRSEVEKMMISAFPSQETPVRMYYQKSDEPELTEETNAYINAIGTSYTYSSPTVPGVGYKKSQAWIYDASDERMVRFGAIHKYHPEHDNELDMIGGEKPTDLEYSVKHESLWVVHDTLVDEQYAVAANVPSPLGVASLGLLSLMFMRRRQ
jgi:hypothetical protein